MPVFPTPSALPNTRIVNGHTMVDLTGGTFAMGSQITHAAFGDCPPHMVFVSPFAAGEKHVTEDQYRAVIGQPGNPKAPANHPVTLVSIPDCAAYLKGCNLGKTTTEEIGFLKEVELEFLERGPVVDVREVMEREGLRNAAELAEYIKTPLGDYLENFVPALELSATIIGTSNSAGFARLIDSASPVFAWRALATRSGRLNPSEAWFDRGRTAPASLTERHNGYVFDAMGNVWSWGADRYEANAYEKLAQRNPYNPPIDGAKAILRGGSGRSHDLLDMRTAQRNKLNPNDRGSDIGLRVGARSH